MTAERERDSKEKTLEKIRQNKSVFVIIMF